MPASMHSDRHPGAARRARHCLAGLAALVGLLAGAAPAAAHQSSDAYLFADQQAGRTTLRWDIALRDLDTALGLDANGDRALTWGEVRSAWPRIDALALAALDVPGCRFELTGHALEQRNDGAYAVLQLAAPCQLSAQAPVRYGLFADIDPTHRGILRHTVAGAQATVRLLVPAALPLPAARLDEAPLLADPAAAALPAPPAAPAAPLAPAPAEAAAEAHAPSFVADGVHHLLTGYDHLLFLLCLLLPAVLRREDGRWHAVRGWRDALLPTARTVTLFTLAHSLTLALAALGWVRLSPSFVEPAIAATIMLAAVDNLRPRLLRWREAVTFGFGLVHGFGFAGVLGELQLPPGQFGWALLQFNLGLELGQLAVVVAVVPLLFLLRRRAAYVPGALGAGSVVALLLAAVWLVERTMDWSLLPA